MPERIKVNKEILDAQCDALGTLCASEDLTNAIAAFDGIISESTGDSAETVKQFREDFTALGQSMALLFKRTLDFLQNKHGDFVQADENM